MAVFSAGSVAQAAGQSSAIMIRPGGMYWSHQFNNGAASETKTTVTHTDLILGLGFRTEMGLYLGGTYTWIQQENKTETTTTTESKETHTAYGPTVGYVGQAFYILGTYHLSPIYVTGTDAAKSTYSGASGYQIDLGYMFWLNGTIGVGPQFTYYKSDFKKLKDSTGNESELPNMASVTDIRPIIAFAFVF